MADSMEFLKKINPQKKMGLALVHYPTYDKEKRVVATNITNFDVHDIARACRTYGVMNYFIVHPMREQLMFVARILDHWRTGFGSKFNPSRRVALEPVQTAENIEKVIADWRAENPNSLVLATTARNFEGFKEYSFEELRKAVHSDLRPVLLIFGTGYGLTLELIQSTDGKVASLNGAAEDGFKHLSVRSAVSIYLDRICGAW